MNINGSSPRIVPLKCSFISNWISLTGQTFMVCIFCLTLKNLHAETYCFMIICKSHYVPHQNAGNTHLICIYLYSQTSHPSCLRTPLDDAIELARSPTTIKISRLRYNFLSIHKTIPWSSIETQITFQISILWRGRFIWPNPVGYFMLSRLGWHKLIFKGTSGSRSRRERWRQWDRVVCGRAFVFTKSGFVGGG